MVKLAAESVAEFENKTSSIMGDQVELWAWKMGIASFTNTINSKVLGGNLVIGKNTSTTRSP